MSNLNKLLLDLIKKKKIPTWLAVILLVGLWLLNQLNNHFNPDPISDIQPQPGRVEQSFAAAKHDMMDVYQGQQTTFYCGCTFDNDKDIKPRSCGLKARSNKARADRLEWEHVVPAHALGHQLQCWQNGGRKNCEKDRTFRLMESDMHNLFPAVGELNGDRSNYRYGMIEGEARAYGKCDFEVDSSTRRVEPPPQVRGDIARTYWYMAEHYGLRISDQQQQLFTAWANQDPVDAWEKERNRRIAKIQGNSNRFVE